MKHSKNAVAHGDSRRPPYARVGRDRAVADLHVSQVRAIRLAFIGAQNPSRVISPFTG